MTRYVLQKNAIRTVDVDGSRFTSTEALGKDVKQPMGAHGAHTGARGTHGNGAAGTAALHGQGVRRSEVAGRIAGSHGSDPRPVSRSIPQGLSGQAAVGHTRAPR